MEQPFQSDFLGRIQPSLRLNDFRFVGHSVEYAAKSFKPLIPDHAIHVMACVVDDVIWPKQNILKLCNVWAFNAEEIARKRCCIAKNSISRREVELFERVCSGKQGLDFSGAHNNRG